MVIFFMMPNMNPAQMRRMMNQFGIKNEELPASRVLIEKPDGSIIEINQPNVTLIEMSGSKTFQITGEVTEKEGKASEKEKSDVDVIVEQTSCTKEEAQNALKETK